MVTISERSKPGPAHALLLLRVRPARRPPAGLAAWPARWRFRWRSAAAASRPTSGRATARRRAAVSASSGCGGAPTAVRGRATLLPVRRITAGYAWCEDPADRRYNRPFRRSANEPGDRLWREDHLYDLIVELDHNTRPRIAGRGSAVFLHVARPGFGPTAGCVALDAGVLRTFLGGSRRRTRNRCSITSIRIRNRHSAGCRRLRFRPGHGSRRTGSRSRKSALIPIDSRFISLRRAILAISAKCGAGASSNGGMHIRPETVRP